MPLPPARVETMADRVRATLDRPDQIEPGLASMPERRRVAESFKARLVAARRYRLDDAMAETVSALSNSHPELLGVLLARGRLPYRSLWLEWPMEAMMRGSGQSTALDTPDLTGVLLEEIDADGLLIRMTPVTFTNGDTLAVGPLALLWHRTDPFGLPVDDEEAPRLCFATGLTLELLRMSLFGSAYAGTFQGNEITAHGMRDADGNLDRERHDHWRWQCAVLSQHAAWTLGPDALSVYRSVLDPSLTGQNVTALRRQLRESVTEWIGTWRFVIAALGLLHATETVTVEAGGGIGARLVRGRRVPNLSHHTIRLTVPREVVVRQQLRELARSSPRRRHEVAGHYANSHTTGDPACRRDGVAGCERAAYVNVTPNLEECQICGHRRWWRRDHERGDAARGYVTKAYVVRNETGGP